MMNTSLAIAHYGNYYTSSTAHSVAMRKFNGIAVQPAKTANRDVYTPDTAADRVSAKTTTYNAPLLKNSSIGGCSSTGTCGTDKNAPILIPRSVTTSKPREGREVTYETIFPDTAAGENGVTFKGKVTDFTYVTKEDGTVVREETVIAEYWGKVSAQWNDKKQQWDVHSGWNEEKNEWFTFNWDDNTKEWMYQSLGTVPSDINQIGLNAGDAFMGLYALLGDKDTLSANKTSLLKRLELEIDDESKELTEILGSLSRQTGLGKIKTKITFAEDKDGNIIIEGKISTKQKKELAKLVNDDPELVERIKNVKAKMEIAEELKKDAPDFSNKKFDAARTQLLKDFLVKNGTTLKDLEAAKRSNGSDQYRGLYDLLESFPELDGEMSAYLARRDTAAKEDTIRAKLEVSQPGTKSGTAESSAVRSLLAMKRGELSEATDEEQDFSRGISDLRGSIYKNIVTEYNDKYNNDPSWQITSFTMKIDSSGRLKITDVQTDGNDPKASAQAERVMNSWLTKEMKEEGKELGLAILEAHDDAHGDVAEYEHEIVWGTFDGGYKILSPDADKAALREMEDLTQDIGTALEDFFHKTMGINNPFAVTFGEDGRLSLSVGSLSSLESNTVKKVLEDINHYLEAEEAGEDTAGRLSDDLSGIGKKLVTMKEVQDKIHDKSLLPKEGTRFTI
jgi:hypothetical protein